MTRTRFPRDAEFASAYLADALNPRERARFEQRLASDSTLQSELNDLAELRTLLHAVPRRRSPRRLTLTPEMVPSRKGIPAFPILRFTSAFATAALAVLLVFVEVLPGIPMATRGAAPMMESAQGIQDSGPTAYSKSPIINWGAAPLGMGGGGGGGMDGFGGGPVEAAPLDAKIAPEQPMADAQPDAQPDAAPIPLAETSPILGVQSPQTPVRQPSVPAIPTTRLVEFGLAIVALGTGLAAWLTHRKLH